MFSQESCEKLSVAVFCCLRIDLFDRLSYGVEMLQRIQ